MSAETYQQVILDDIKSLSSSKLKEVLDFVRYMRAKEEWDATFEITNDKILSAKIRQGLADVTLGEIEEIVL